MNTIQYHPQLGGIISEAQIEAEYISIIGKWRVITKLELRGRGIKLDKKYTTDNLVPQAQHLVGFNKYYCTDKAMEVLEKNFKVRQPLYFD